MSTQDESGLIEGEWGFMNIKHTYMMFEVIVDMLGAGLYDMVVDCGISRRRRVFRGWVWWGLDMIGGWGGLHGVESDLRTCCEQG